MSYKIFISSSREDQDLVDDLGQRLRSASASIQLLGTMQAVGGEFPRAVQKSIEEADEVIPLVTRESLQSAWLFLELGASISQHKQVTPVVVGLEPEDLPALVREMRYVRYSEIGAYLPRVARRAALKAEKGRSSAA